MSDNCPDHAHRNPACPICARVSRSERESELAALSGSPCVVCGSPLTLGVERAVPVLMVHCNTCGSEVPWHVTQKLNLYKARGKTAASTENAPDQRPGAKT
jgi:hypothetical protein